MEGIMNRKEEIMKATATLASQKGLANVSLSQIAKKIGISKAALYNHFSSKEEIIIHLYEYLRKKASGNLNTTDIDYGQFVKGKDATTILNAVVNDYKALNSGTDIANFYKIIASEQFYSKEASEIMARETERMIRATKNLFYAMEVHHILKFNNVDYSAISFALTIHGMLDYENILHISQNDNNTDIAISDYIDFFCAEYQI